MNALDWYVVRELGCPAYLRYVDDFALFADGKRQLWEWKEAVLAFLATRRLTVHESEAQVQPVATGIPWLGFVVYPTHRLLKRRNVVSFARRFHDNYDQFCAGHITFAELDASVQGWINHVRYGDTWGLRKTLLARKRARGTTNFIERPLMDITFNTYYTYPELTDRLTWLAEQHPAIMQLATLGKTYEGRDIPLVVLTNRETGPDTEKPAFWIDANIHATELTASMAALYFVKKAVEGYGRDPKITRVLNEAAIYVVPRLNPDGAEWALAKNPKFIRSGTRPYPFQERRDGLYAEDIDGDGRILQMRLGDPTGDWKVSDRDPRLMVKRTPDEEGGIYYRLFPEGPIENYDGHLIEIAPALQGLDFNRNFPGAWRPEGEQRGAGDFPGSEPEIRAVVQFMTQHPNVFGALTFHTYSRAILRPYGTKADDQMETDDLWVFEAIGARGTALTGYPVVSVYHHFRYHPKEIITGVFDDWLFDHKGIFAFTVEMWDLATAAGVKEKNSDKKFMDWFRVHPLEDDYKILDFVNEHAADGLVAWYPFEHPQLGPVELGGWNNLYTWRNPPHALLEAEIAPHADFALAFASLAPRIAWHEVTLTPLGNGRSHLLAMIENTGFLPTNGSKQAAKMKAVQPVRLELELPAGATLLGGKAKQEIKHLEGRSNKLDMAYYGSSPTDNRGRAEWLIDAPQGGTLTLRAVAERGGTIIKALTLGHP